MKKRKKGRTLSRDRSQRVALLRTMATSLILHKKITTTQAKAKELRPFVERIASHSKKALDEKNRQNVIRLLKKNLHVKAIKELIKMAESFKNRKGGYLRIVKIGPRKSDSSAMAIVEWVDIEREDLKKQPDKAKQQEIKKEDKKIEKKDKKAK
jgi:large subunit ribosomal protein L17